MMNKKDLFSLCMMALGVVGAQGQGAAPYVIDADLQAPRTGFVAYRSVEAALAGDAAVAENFALQDGTWWAKPVVDKHLLADVSPGAPIENWTKVELPLAQPGASKGSTLYARDVTVPFDYLDKELYLRVEGFGGGRVTLYVNGQEVGSATDSRVTSEWDITQTTRRGINRVVLAVDQQSESSPIEAPSVGGINRSVWLVAQPKVRMRDFLVRTSLDPTYTNGLLETALLLKSELLNPHSVTVHYDLYDRNGKLVNQAFREVSLDMRREDTVRFTASIPGVEKWSAETPSLYTVVYRVKREGRWTEVAARKVGFRTVAIENDQLLINGHAPQFRGVNIQEQEPKQMLAELLRLKRAGFNALRTGGTPLPAFFYEQTDSLGFYVWSVANAQGSGAEVANRATWSNTPSWREVFERRALANYELTKTYPSVVAIALGQGAGNGYGMYHAYRAIKQRDPLRVVVYDGANAEWNTDVFCPINPTVAQLRGAQKMKIQQPIIASRVAYDPVYWDIVGVQGAFVDRWDASNPAPWPPLVWSATGKANQYHIENRLNQTNLSYFPVWVRVKPLSGQEQWVKAAPIECAAGAQTDYTLQVQGKPLEVRIGTLFDTIL